VTAPLDAPARPTGFGRILTEIRLFLTAVMFYTRIPVPAWVGYSDEQLNRSTRYFPAIGWMVGAAVAATLVFTDLVWPQPVAAILALAAGVVVTGAFHEDGFADVCDGFGGGMNRQRTLEIMKDSRVGAFAVIGLVLLFGVKIAALTALVGAGVWSAVAAIVFAHVASRWCVVTIIFSDVYARDDLTSKVKPIGRKISKPGLAAATAWMLPFVGLAGWHPWWLVAIPVAFGLRWWLARWFRRRLGGYTGDCLGATQQILEVAITLVIVACVGFGA
jgi:adenosylcobinamide-GDP ribazoletransferase